MLSYYFAGMCVDDVFRPRWNDFQNDLYHREMGKNNIGELLQVLEIFNQYKATQQKKDDLGFWNK